MVVTIFGGDLRTGLIRVRNIAATNGSCNTRLGGAGTIGAGVQLPQEDPLTGRVLPINEILLPGKSFLAWEEDGVILNAGPIWTAEYSFDTKKLQLNAAGLRSYWQYRFVLPALNDADADDLPAGKDTIFLDTDGLALRTIAKRLVQQAQTWTGGSVPVVFEPDYAGSAARTYRGHELHVVEEKLKQLSEVENGPDIMFNARYTSPEKTHLEWLMETGDPQIKQAGAPHKWDASGLPNPAIKGATITRDATSLTTDNYQTGSVPEATEDDPDPYPLMAKSVDPYLPGPDIFSAWTEERRNAARNPLQVAGGYTGENLTPSAGFTASNVTGISDHPLGITTAARQTRTSAGSGSVIFKWYSDLFTSTPSVVAPAIDQPCVPGTVPLSVWVKTTVAASFYIRARFFNSTTASWTSSQLNGSIVAVPANTWTLLTFDAVAPAGTTHVAALMGTPSSATAWLAGSYVQQTGIQVGALPFIAGDLTIDSLKRTRWLGTANASVTVYETRTLLQPSRMFPRLETSTDRSSVISQSVLQSGADQATLVGRLYTETWKFLAKKDVVPKVTEYRVGHFGKIVTKDDPMVGTAEHVVRIMEITSTLGNPFANLTCAPSREEI